MQALVLVMLLAVTAVAEPPEARPERAIAGLAARQTPPSEPATVDPCAVARGIVRQPPCLAAGDCPSLELWRRSFGPPGPRLLDPERPDRSLAAGGRARPRASVGDPKTRPFLPPGVICPLGDEPRR